MTKIALVRHGPTDWNAEHRLQGRADRSLSEDGRSRVARWRVPSEYRDFEWVTSPLLRARETAGILGLSAAGTEDALIEMDWGEWEGHTRAELDVRFGAEVGERTAKGLDLRPHGGESPREVRTRFAAWARGVAAAGRPTGAVCHQGIIRAALSLATGWDMLGKPPVRMDWDSLHLFEADAGGGFAIARTNIGLIGA